MPNENQGSVLTDTAAATPAPIFARPTRLSMPGPSSCPRVSLTGLSMASSPKSPGPSSAKSMFGLSMASGSKSPGPSSAKSVFGDKSSSLSSQDQQQQPRSFPSMSAGMLSFANPPITDPVGADPFLQDSDIDWEALASGDCEELERKIFASMVEVRLVARCGNSDDENDDGEEFGDLDDHDNDVCDENELGDWNDNSDDDGQDDCDFDDEDNYVDDGIMVDFFGPNWKEQVEHPFKIGGMDKKDYGNDNELADDTLNGLADGVSSMELGLQHRRNRFAAAMGYPNVLWRQPLAVLSSPEARSPAVELVEEASVDGGPISTSEAQSTAAKLVKEASVEGSVSASEIPPTVTEPVKEALVGGLACRSSEDSVPESSTPGYSIPEDSAPVCSTLEDTAPADSTSEDSTSVGFALEALAPVDSALQAPASVISTIEAPAPEDPTLVIVITEGPTPETPTHVDPMEPAIPHIELAEMDASGMADMSTLVASMTLSSHRVTMAPTDLSIDDSVIIESMDETMTGDVAKGQEAGQKRFSEVPEAFARPYKKRR
ncbi:hypothetical protein BGX23_009616 [Mortierella sp. AD031]|nr:hypothetical protein BGX23_009616 [Mortierella sp. AD031]